MQHLEPDFRPTKTLNRFVIQQNRVSVSIFKKERGNEKKSCPIFSGAGNIHENETGV